MTYRDVRVTLTIDGVKYSQKASVDVQIPLASVEGEVQTSISQMFDQHGLRLQPTIFTSGKRGIAEPNWYVPVNPILTAFRERVLGTRYFMGGTALDYWLEYLLDWDGSICAATPNEIAHARKVLTRLAALTKEN